MLYAIIAPAVIIFIAVLLLGFRIFFFRNGKFPNIHIGGNKALSDKGIDCATTQHREAQKKRGRMSVPDMANEITKNF
ncbi:MAG TPA: hypothetical protein VK152_01300 [Paludibacter sp.]|nr:hypothetical protein [Paludibacter sp.]